MKTPDSVASKHTGIQYHRLTKAANNPDEVLFHDAWIEEQRHGQILGRILGTNERNPRTPTESECKVAATVIQWLGTNCGRSFLREVVQKSENLKDWLK